MADSRAKIINLGKTKDIECEDSVNQSVDSESVRSHRSSRSRGRSFSFSRRNRSQQKRTASDDGNTSSGSNDALLGYELICLKFRKAVIAVIAANRLLKGSRKTDSLGNQCHLNQAEISKCVQLFKVKPFVAVTDNIIRTLQAPS